MRANANDNDEVRASGAFSSLCSTSFEPAPKCTLAEREEEEFSDCNKTHLPSVCLSDRPPPPYLLVTVDDHRGRRPGIRERKDRGRVVVLYPFLRCFGPKRKRRSAAIKPKRERTNGL